MFTPLRWVDVEQLSVHKTGRYGRERGRHAEKDHRQESNPDRCDQAWALMVDALNALPVEPPGRRYKKSFNYKRTGDWYAR